MQKKDSKIFVISVKNISKKLEYYGDADINNISLLKLIYKYSKYFEGYDQLQAVDKMVNYLQRSDMSICMEYTYAKGYSQEYKNNVIDITGQDPENTPPVLTDVSITYGNNDTQEISYNELFSGYSDSEGTGISYIKIHSLPAVDSLFTNNGKPISAGEVIDVNDLDFYIEYDREDDTARVDTFTYSVFDSAQTPLESNIVTATVTLPVYSESDNEAPTIGDLALYADNRESITITIQDILVGSDPDYMDPEGDQLGAIRIDRISASNKGIYYYYGTEIQVGQVISYNDILAGAFTYAAADINFIQTDVIEVSIRDDADSGWVSD